MTKVIAYYLPQFHEIPENDAWWGKGFTEWTNLKKARPLFNGHHQPNEPLNDNYYNLLDKETVVWQTELAKKYSVYAFNYYHYWFKGKKILEKPAENLLKWKDIDQKFMFMWANHDWTRSWVGGKEILLKLEYGEEKDWVEHATYLMQFFLDPRYIKVENKPVFQIYNRQVVSNFEEMVAVWDRECRKNGLNGIYIVDNVTLATIRKNGLSRGCDAITLQEHTSAIEYMMQKDLLFRVMRKAKRVFFKNSDSCVDKSKGGPNDKITTYNYNKIVKNSLAVMKLIKPDIKAYFGVCTGWDNTPRYGRRGYLVDGANPDNFRKYLTRAKELSEKREQEFIFLACWNEWCEGMVLEPTKKYGYGFLEAIDEVFREERRG